MILSLTLFCLAAICNAVMDVCAHHYSISIFTRAGFTRQFWDTSISWKNKYKNLDPTQGRTHVPVFLTDAWHFFKSLCITLICASIAILAYAANQHQQCLTILQVFYIFAIYGCSWNIFFGIFYNRILVK